MIPRDWEGLPAVVIASGPSLTVEDVEHCRGKAKVVVVNDNYKLAPWADVLYAADRAWWAHHLPSMEFAGERWTSARFAVDAYGIVKVPVESSGRRGFSFKPASIHGGGGNSGFQALNVALLRGANPICLLGFDMQATDGKKHWFGCHPGALNRYQHFARWVKEINYAAAGAAKAGIRIVNCSRSTAITAYERAPIQEVVR